jgi:hypothetical protein
LRGGSNSPFSSYISLFSSMQNFVSLYESFNESIDTFDAVGTGDTVSGSTSYRNLPVLERMPKEETSRNCDMSKLKCPPSMVNHIRHHHKTESSSQNSGKYRHPIDSMMYSGDEEKTASAFVGKKFGLSSAQSIVASFTNPCSPGIQSITEEDEEDDDDDDDDDCTNSFVKPSPYSKRSSETPPTSCSSSESDGDDDISRSTEKDSAYSVVRTSTVRQNQGRSHADQVQDGTNVLFSYRSPLPNFRDVFVLVGSELYQLTNTSAGCIVKRLNDQATLPRDKMAVIDMSCHSPAEWNIVMGFLNPCKESRERISWSKLPLLLPWFVELPSLPLAGEADMFLLQNVLGGRSDGTARPINLESLLQLSKIAYSCGLESTKTQVRRFLRHSLLHPRKHTSATSSNVSEQDEFELEWTLDDLKALAELMAIFDECREYLWEYAVITYLPHDLDISDSWGLVSNRLFPYLLREGMMQMMILESMEASTSSENAPFNRKTNKSFSDATTSSDTTIPTSPTKGLSPKEIECHLIRIIRHLEKFQTEKDTHLTEYYSEDSSTISPDQAASSRNSGQRRNRRIQPVSPPPIRQERFSC